MALKKIFVHRTAVDGNEETGRSDPVFTVIDLDEVEHRTSNIVILGPSAIRYDQNAEKGKRVWIETFDKIVLKDAVDETGKPTIKSV